MEEIRIVKNDELETLLKINLNAYPRFKMNSSEAFQNALARLSQNREKDDSSEFYGFFRDNELLGGMKLYNFNMNLMSQKIKTGGIGSVAVDLLRKKEGICKKLLEFSLRYFRKNDCPLVTLYPFRPDFYKKMGFGFGSKINHFRITPASIPPGKRDHVRYLDITKKEKLLNCYEKFVENHSGMIHRNSESFDRILNQFENVIVGYEKDDEVLGYLVFTFKKASENNFVLNDIEVKELVYLNPEALRQLLAFLHYQKDQINRVIINTQDRYFHFLFDDPRDDSTNLIPSVYHQMATSGIGFMYRIVDTPQFFQEMKDKKFGNESLFIRFKINDTFLPENSGNFFVNFKNGTIITENSSKPDLDIEIDISDLSSMAVGAIKPSVLYYYGKIKLSDPKYVKTLDNLFEAPSPVCMTGF